MKKIIIVMLLVFGVLSGNQGFAQNDHEDSYLKTPETTDTTVAPEPTVSPKSEPVVQKVDTATKASVAPHLK